jgi:hypothetical protein
MSGGTKRRRDRARPSPPSLGQPRSRCGCAADQLPSGLYGGPRGAGVRLVGLAVDLSCNYLNDTLSLHWQSRLTDHVTAMCGPWLAPAAERAPPRSERGPRGARQVHREAELPRGEARGPGAPSPQHHRLCLLQPLRCVWRAWLEILSRALDWKTPICCGGGGPENSKRLCVLTARTPRGRSRTPTPASPASAWTSATAWRASSRAGRCGAAAPGSRWAPATRGWAAAAASSALVPHPPPGRLGALQRP